MNILVSIIVPVYNVEKLVGKCIQSICNQSYENIEIIIVNDGSTDNSLEVIRQYKDNDPRIQLIDQKNMGLSGARNRGISAAKGKYIVFVDSDDMIEPSLVKECLALIEQDSSDIVVYGYKKVKENLTLIAQPDNGNRTLDQKEALNELLSLNISPMACNKFIKAELFKQNNIEFPLGKLHEDIGTTYKLFAKANKITTTSKSYYYWINREDSITGTITFKHINHLVELLIEKRVFLKDNNIYIKYNKAYNIGSLKMINLTLERALNTSKSLVEYVLYIVDHNLLISKEDIELLKPYEEKNVTKFYKLYTEGKNFIKNKDINIEDYYLLQKQNRDLTKKLETIHNSAIYGVLKKYHTARDLMLPKGSRSRKLIKKLLNK